MYKEKDKNFLPLPFFNICRSHFTSMLLLMLNGSHSMSVNHQHVCPLPLSLLAVFLGKGALLKGQGYPLTLLSKKFLS